MKRFLRRIGGAVLIALGSQAPSMAWDYEGHRLINQLALASLPTLRTMGERRIAQAERKAA